MKATMQSIHANRAGSVWETRRGEDWRDRAACVGKDPEWWFSYSSGELALARSICGKCPVAVQCLKYALESDERYGIFGGLDEYQRASIRRKEAKEEARKESPVPRVIRPRHPREHGTTRGYRQHKNLQERPCQPCKDAAREQRAEQAATQTDTPRRARSTADLLEALDTMRGESPERVAQRLGMTLSGISRTLRRAGKHNEARLFDQARHYQRKEVAS